MATTDVTGKRPLTFTDSDGGQRFIPLAALEFDGTSVKLAAAWKTALGPADSAALLAVAQRQADTGDLAPPPVLPPTPAVRFSATVAGEEGNGISLALSAQTGGFKLAVKEVDVYPGLDGAAAAAAAIGVEKAAAKPGQPEGTGIVHVHSAAFSAGMPKDVAGVAMPAAGLDVKTADDAGVLMRLLPRDGFTGTGITVTIATDQAATPKTFTVTASYDSGQPSAVTSASLGSLPAKLAFVITAAPPPGGYAPPAAVPDLRLQGGGDGVAAAAIAYTS
jgi:hypothetical protein